MSDPKSLHDFFAAWTIADTDGRTAKVASAVSSDFSYSDPRTEQPITDVDVMSDYLSNFLKMCPPGAQVAISDPVDFNGISARATVQFIMGPDMKQTGQYFADFDAAGKLSRLVGFVGKGAE